GGSRSPTSRASRRSRSRPRRSRASKRKALPRLPVQADLRGDIAKLPAAQVPVQFARAAADLLPVRSLQGAAAGEEDVEQAVLVVVEQGHTAAQRLEDRELVGLLAVAVGEVHSRGCGHVLEKGGRLQGAVR